jgi:hypothetical protein
LQTFIPGYTGIPDGTEDFRMQSILPPGCTYDFARLRGYKGKPARLLLRFKDFEIPRGEKTTIIITGSMEVTTSELNLLPFFRVRKP